MNVILTGATGFVGSEVLAQLLERPEITRVTCLVRQPLSMEEPESPKLETILHEDFATYNLQLAQRLAEHSACIWTVGGKASDSSEPKEFERLTYTFPINFAQAIAENLTQPFRFCYLSSMGADPTEKSRFPWQKATRHLKGRTERELERLTERHSLFRATSFRPGSILSANTSSVTAKLLAPVSIPVDVLAKAMIDRVISGRSHYRVITNSEIRKFAMST